MSETLKPNATVEKPREGGWGPVVTHVNSNEGPTDPTSIKLSSKEFWLTVGVGAAMGVLGYLALLPH